MTGSSIGYEGITKTVAEITALDFQGVIVPHAWWQSDRLKSKSWKPNAIAIILLADLCHSYQGEMLQRTYESWAQHFNFTKSQVRAAASFLIERGLIRRELRTVIIDGIPASNITFFEPVMSEIQSLSAGR